MKLESDFVKDSLKVNLTYMFCDAFGDKHYTTDSGYLLIGYDEEGKRTFSKLHCEGDIQVSMVGKMVGLGGDWWPNIVECSKNSNIRMKPGVLEELTSLGLSE